MHAAVEHPDLAMLMWEGGSSASHEPEGDDSPLPGSKQVGHPHIHGLAPKAGCLQDIDAAELGKAWK